MRKNSQYITKALLVVALLSIFGVAMAQTPVNNILDLWNVRGNLSGSYTQTADIDLISTNSESLMTWSTNMNYTVGSVVKHPTDGYAYYCITAQDPSPTFPTANWTKMWEAAKGWQPIGATGTPFTGIYNGDNFTISNLYINRKAADIGDTIYPTDGEDNVGLFGLVQSVSGATVDTEIKYVHLIDPNVSGRRGTGSLIGKVLLPTTAGKTVITSWCSAVGGTVSGFGATGGLVGANNSDRKQRVPIIRYSFSNVAVSSTHPTNTTLNPQDSFGKPIKYNPYNIKYGGVVGCNENGVTSDSYAWGPVSGGDRVGGVAGCTINGSIIRCYSISNPIVQNIYSAAWEGGVGGITGRTAGNLPPGLGGATSNGSVDNSYYDGSIDINDIGGPVIESIGNTSGPRTSAQLNANPGTYNDTFVNWDTVIWNFDNPYPTFQGSPTLKAYYYKTVSIGNWSNPLIWQKSPTGAAPWIATTTYPDLTNSVKITVDNDVNLDIDVNVNHVVLSSSGIINIQNGKTLKAESGYQVSIDNYGAIIVDEGGTLIIDQSALLDNSVNLTINGNLIIYGTINWTKGSDPNISATAGPNSTISYKDTVAQSTGAGFPSSANDVVIDNLVSVTFTNSVTIDGTLTVNNGTVSGSSNTDGYHSPDLNFLEIAESSQLISGFTATTSLVPANYPLRISREWEIDGNINDADEANRTKTLTFTWTSDDDNSYDWNSGTPAVYVDDSENGITGTYTDVDGVRTLVVAYTFDLLAPNSAPTFRIGRSDNGTLPVELSSFTAQPYQGNSVMIQWCTQSETNVLGFSIYRGLDDDLAAALRLDITIPATNTSQAKTYVYYDREVQSGQYYYWLESSDYDGDSQLFGPVNIHLNGSDPGSPDVIPIPGFRNIYPNPFNPEATIRFGVDKAGTVDIKIYNHRGQLVRNLVNTEKSKGWHKAIWDGKNDQGNRVSSGVYFARMNMNGKQYLRKMVMTK